MAFQVNVAGDTTTPRLTGTLELDGGAVGATMLPNPIDDINLLVRFNSTEATLDRASAHFGPSSIDLTGGVVRLSGRDIERVDIPLVVRNLSLVPQQGVEVALDADTRLVWSPSDELPLFAGDVTLTRVRYTRPISMSQDLSGNVSVGGSSGGATASLGAGDSGDTPYDPRNDHVRLDLRIHDREPIRVANNIADAQIHIAEEERAFRVLGTDQRLGVLGTLTVARGGRVQFRGNDFEIRRGRIEFDNPEHIQPNFDVSAQTEIRRGNDSTRNQWRVDLHAYGTTDRFALDMSSDPALSREDIALLLTFRMTRAELDQVGGSNLAQGLAVEALATATGLDRTVRNAVPVIDDFRIGSAYSPTQGRTVTQVYGGRRINDRVRVGATVNTTDRSEVRATTDVQVDNHTSVQVGWDNMNQQSGSSFGNLGADLRWRLEFE
jgi:translocation and assembly module TamB